VTLCAGTSSATLTASPTGATYSWSTGASTQAINPTGIAATTTYTVSATVTGCSATASQTITVVPTVPAPSTTGYSVCLNGTVPSGQGLTATANTTSYTTVTSFSGTTRTSSPFYTRSTSGTTYTADSAGGGIITPILLPLQLRDYTHLTSVHHMMVMHRYMPARLILLTRQPILLLPMMMVIRQPILAQMMQN
jgi:hypothetical protein